MKWSSNGFHAAGHLSLGTALVLAGCVTSCEGDRAPAAWSSLSTCLAGNARSADLPTRLRQIRQIQLNRLDANASVDGWPGRCMKHANELHAALDTSGKPALMRRSLEAKLGCAEGKSSCKLANDESLIPTTTALWEAARDAELVAGPAPGAPLPKAEVEPALNAKTWRSFSEKPTRTDGPWMTPDGRAYILLVEPEGKSKPMGCEVSKGFGELSCTAPHADVPELPQQTVRLVAEPQALYAAGLVETKMMAFELKTGKSLQAFGSVGRPQVNGLALEDEATPEPKAVPTPKKRGKAPEASPPAPGLVALNVKDGKATKPTKLATKVPVLKPISLHGHAIWVESVGESTQLVIQSSGNGQLKDVAKFNTPLFGSFHTCEGAGNAALAVWDRRASLPRAKPTAGDGKTQLTFTQYQNGTWSRPVLATLPFDRLVESELHCTKDGASISWVTKTDDGIEVGRLDCSSDTCKSSQVRVPGIESKWWWLVSPVGDSVMLVWRSSLGETRARVAKLADLPSAKDSLLFDTSDYGGPSNTDARSVVTSDAALLVFTDERPVALRVGLDGSAKVLGAKAP